MQGIPAKTEDFPGGQRRYDACSVILQAVGAAAFRISVQHRTCLAEKAYLLHTKMFFPFPADHKKLRRNGVQQLI